MILAPSLRLSIVVPVYQGREHLERVLAAITSSDLPEGDWELIVVDDSSSDDSAAIAAGYADLVIRLSGGPRGPAYARNRGFEAARGSFVAFVDADVLVHPQALGLMLATIDRDERVGAVIGVYDDRSTSNRTVSEYRNLVRHFEHETDTGETSAFTAGLAVTRREAFVLAGMFDEWRFPRAQAEALEFGHRLRSLDYRIVRPAGAAATHLKRWTVRDWLRVDLLDRGVSVARLSQFGDLRTLASRLYVTTTVDALLAWVALTSLVLDLWLRSIPMAMVTLGAVLGLVIHRASLFASFTRSRGVMFALAAVPLHLLACAVYSLASATGRLMYHAVGESQPDPVVQAFSEVGARTWPPIPSRRALSRPDSVPLHSDNGGRSS